MTRSLFSVLVLALVAGNLAAQPPVDPKRTEAAARATAKQLRAHLVPAPGAEWNDFALRVADAIGTDEYGAAAGWEEWADGTATPYITITRSTLTALVTPNRVADEDAVALVLAYEHARLVLGLVPRKGKPKTDATDADADLYAVKLLLRSGYSVRRGLGGVAGIPEKSRPAWYERVVKLLEKPDESVWRSMPAFENGLTFLAVENHIVAVVCFEAVTREFPTAHDAWANLGYARLMWYFDQFAAKGSPVDMPGHVSGISHAIRPSLSRRIELKRWFDVVGALREAERLKAGQPLVLSSLGLAYFLTPTEEIGSEAEKYLTAARDALKKQPNPAGEVELLVNLAVVRLAAKKTADAGKLLDEAAALAAKLPGGPPAQYTRAITFNRALALVADAKPAEAVKLFVRFLETTPRYDPWWSEGYRHYETLCKKLEVKPLERDKLQKPVKTQSQSVVLAPKHVVQPGDDAEEALSRLPKPSSQRRATPRTSLMRMQFLAQGVELFADPEDQVLLVVAVSKKAAVPWPATDRGGRPAGDLRVGMTRKEVSALPDGSDFVPRPFAPRAGTCAYYPAWELAVVYDRDGPDGVVTAVVVGPGVR